MSFTDYPYYCWVVGLLFVVLFLKKQHYWIPLLFYSVIFYGYGRWEYLYLLFISTSIDYYCGISISSTESLLKRRLLLVFSIVSNLSILFFFKYFPELYEHWGWIEKRDNVTDYLQNIVIPLGISFYTLQSMGYTIDVYLKKIQPEKHFGYFALYICFFPQLVAGPIERPHKLLPQLRMPGTITIANLQTGMFLIGFGLFKKLIISDRLFILLNDTLINSDNLPGWQALAFGTFSILAIYIDISAYTDIARGSARLFGIELSTNFKRPMLALNASEFWRRWHISLTGWIMNYVFKPLAGLSKSKAYRSLITIFTFLVVGVWHGPSLTYFYLGLVSGVLIVLERMAFNYGLKWPDNLFFNTLRYLRTQIFVNISGVLFLAPDMDVTMKILSQIFNFSSFFAEPSFIGKGNFFFALLLGGALLTIMITTEKSLSWIHKRNEQLSVWSKYSLLYVQFFIVIAFGARKGDEFIYFIF